MLSPIEEGSGTVRSAPAAQRRVQPGKAHGNGGGRAMPPATAPWDQTKVVFASIWVCSAWALTSANRAKQKSTLLSTGSS